MAQAIPHMAFNGNCSEAMRFYERVLGLGAKLEMMLSGAERPWRRRSRRSMRIGFCMRA